MRTCPYRSRPGRISRHRAEDGLTVRAHGVCGSLRARAVTARSGTVATRGGPRVTSVQMQHSSPPSRV